MGKKQRKPVQSGPAPAVYEQRWKAAAWLVVALAAISAVVLIYQEGGGAATDAVSLNEARFAELAHSLSPHDTLGYLSDIGGSNMTSNGPYFMAQYAVAPALLDPGTSHNLILGNFSTPAAIDAALQANGLLVVRDFGNGVLLMKKAGR